MVTFGRRPLPCVSVSGLRDVMAHIPLALEDLQLTPEEQQRILDVVERDEALRQEENLRIRSVFLRVYLTD